ncbi:MAG: adenylyltransferase/cytidyltransferase family protein, partial [Sedimentisphaerales bacterium]|nr:adenylyltransferase/cytidyltransferase family protein [Sedimentisphaerales bacterium]
STINSITGQNPKFPLAERQYHLESVRFVSEVTAISLKDANVLPKEAPATTGTWVVHASDDTTKKQSYCRQHNLNYKVISDKELEGFPEIEVDTNTGNKKVIVTGCYDWFHTGHIRFFEEVSELGDLYVVVGHDANILALKGPGHPMFNERERMYMVQSIRFVKQAMISTGGGWLDAEPEIQHIRPDIYVVNEDGDKPIKRQYCEENGIEYVVLKRLPKEGLPHRESTHLRGF